MSKKEDPRGEEYLVIGKVLKPHGVKGDLRVRYYNPEDPLFLSRYKRLYLKDERRGLLRPFKVLKVRPHKDLLIVSLEGLRDREDAERWRGSEVLVRREDLPPLEEDEYYWEEIIGLEVFTKEGESLGRVTSIWRTGGSDVYVVEGEKGEIMLPAIKQVVLEVDREGGRMVVELLEGLLEEG